MEVAIPVLDLAPDGQLDKFQSKLSNAKGKVAVGTEGSSYDGRT